MSRSVLLRPIAKVEFDEAVNWFEGKRVGLSFTDAVRDTIRTISESPLMYRKLYRDIRAVSVTGFPYQIFYRVLKDDSIEVLSVFQVRRDPASWRKR